MLINLFEDKIERILDQHNVVTSDLEKLKTDLVNAFLESQLPLKKRQLSRPPQEFLEFMEKEEKEKFEDSKQAYKCLHKWITKTPEGEKWVRSILGITEDILTSDIAIQYVQSNGAKHSLKPNRTIIYYRERPERESTKKKEK